MSTWLVEPDDGYIDEVAVGKALAGERVGLTYTERLEVTRRILAAGHGPAQVRTRLGIGSSHARRLVAEAEPVTV